MTQDVAVQTTFSLTDAVGRRLGDFIVEELKPNAVCGTFVRGADYPEVEERFLEAEEVVNSAFFSDLDRVQDRIEQLQPRLGDGTIIYDLQIYSDGNASFRLRPFEPFIPAEFH